MGKNQVLFLSQMEESKMAKQVHIRVDDDIYKELSDYSVVSGQSMQDCLSVANARQGKGRTFSGL